MRFQVGGIYHHNLLIAMLCDQCGFNLREDTLVTPTLPAIVKSPVGTVFLGSISPAQPVAFDEIIPLNTRRSSTRACHGTSGSTVQAASSARP